MHFLSGIDPSTQSTSTQPLVNTNQEAICNGRKWKCILYTVAAIQCSLSMPCLVAGVILENEVLIGVASGLFITAILIGLATAYCFPCTRVHIENDISF